MAPQVSQWRKRTTKDMHRKSYALHSAESSSSYLCRETGVYPNSLTLIKSRKSIPFPYILDRPTKGEAKSKSKNSSMHLYLPRRKEKEKN